MFEERASVETGNKWRQRKRDGKREKEGEKKEQIERKSHSAYLLRRVHAIPSSLRLSTVSTSGRDREGEREVKG